MKATDNYPEWDTISENLKAGLGYSEATLKRTKYTYHVFKREFCYDYNGGDAESIIKHGIERADNAFETGNISKDKLLRIRRLAFRILQYIETGRITWERAPLYGRQYGEAENEALLAAYVSTEKSESRHAESIIKRDENIIRQYILYAEENDINILKADACNMIAFLSHMKRLRPAGLQSTASALKHFYLYLIEIEKTQPGILAAIKAWDTPHKRIYGIFSEDEKRKLAAAPDESSDVGKRDKAVIMLAIDCGLRSSDICNLKLTDIDWRTASLNIIQKKTGTQVAVPFSNETGNALADYILNARGTSPLPYVFLKRSYFDSAMTSALLCHRLKKLMKKAGINRPASEKISMHTFRRSLGTSLVNSGETMEMVAQVLGHKDKEATKGYISVSERMLRLCPLPMPELSERKVCYDQDEV